MAIPANYPLASKSTDYLEQTIRIHGGITYHQQPEIGFDTAHSGDRTPMGYGYDEKDGPTKYWTYEDARTELMRLVDEIDLLTV